MTAPMPETMSPRDEVEYWLSLAMVAGLHKQDFSLTEAADAILAALASSDDQLSGNPGQLKSGDHAELAEQARRDIEWSCLTTVRPSVLLDLLAENAALRDEHVHLVEQKEGAEDALFNALSRATEAERKLAEAVGHMNWMRNFVPTVWGSTEERLDEIDAFLSKEAERG